jgi:hypothetical protein
MLRASFNSERGRSNVSQSVCGFGLASNAAIRHHVQVAATFVKGVCKGTLVGVQVLDRETESPLVAVGPKGDFGAVAFLQRQDKHREIGRSRRCGRVGRADGWCDGVWSRLRVSRDCEEQ